MNLERVMKGYDFIVLRKEGYRTNFPLEKVRTKRQKGMLVIHPERMVQWKLVDEKECDKLMYVKLKKMKTSKNSVGEISPGKKNIFIVEDNEIYAKSLQTFIQIRFPEIKEIKIFCIGEMCLLELHRNPFIIIMDYFLNSRYEEADNGLEIIKRIKGEKPQTNIILLSAQEKYNVALEAINQYDCIYVQKDQEAFNKVEQFIKTIFILKNH